MTERVEAAFRAFLSSLQIARLYDTAHAKFLKSLDAAFAAFLECFATEGEVVIGIVEDEIAYKNEVLFELSRSVKPMIAALKERGVERLVFSRRMHKDELKKLIEVLMLSKEKMQHPAQEYLDGLGVRNISVGKLKVEGSGQEESLEKARQAIDYLNLYNASLENFSQSVDKMINDEAIDALDLRMGVSALMENMALRSQELLKLTTVKRYDVTTFVHITNVSILAMFFASRLGFSRDDVAEIGTAALFHDIGKLAISRKVIKKEGKLTDEEFALMKSHTVLGAEILLKYVDNLGILPVVVCFEHHLKYDLSGYPRLKLSKKPHIASLIVTICDVYDALLQRRSYKASFAPMVIYDIMNEEKGKAFEPALLESFFRIMGVWPVGTLVGLNDGRVAVVRQVNEDEIFLPQVQVLTREGSGETIDLKETKEKVWIEKYLDALGEGKEYLPLI